MLLSHFSIEESEAEDLFASLDADKSHEIEYTEFVAAALIGRVKVHADVLQKTFKRFDRDGDGKIDKVELKYVLGDTFAEKEIEDLMQEADTSGDGTLDYDEFFAYFNKVIENLMSRVSPSSQEEVVSECHCVGRRSNTAPASARSLPVLLSHLRLFHRAEKA